MSVQRIVEDSPAIDLQAEAQHTSGELENPVSDLIDIFYVFCKILVFLATFPAEIRSNLPVKTDSLGERWLSKSYDAQRSPFTQSNILGATVCGHNKD